MSSLPIAFVLLHQHEQEKRMEGISEYLSLLGSLQYTIKKLRWQWKIPILSYVFAVYTSNPTWSSSSSSSGAALAAVSVCSFESTLKVHNAGRISVHYSRMGKPSIPLFQCNSNELLSSSDGVSSSANVGYVVRYCAHCVIRNPSWMFSLEAGSKKPNAKKKMIYMI